MIALSLILITLSIMLVVITLSEEGWAWLSFRRYRAECEALIVSETPANYSTSKGLVEKLEADGSFHYVAQTQSKSSGKPPFYFELFEKNKVCYVLEWPAKNTLWRGHYRYLKEKGSWKVGDTIPIRYQPDKPWHYSVEDRELWQRFIIKLASEAVLIFTSIALMVNISTHVSQAPSVGVGEVDMKEVWRSAISSSLSPIVVEHGEDYVISWEDAGMEAHIRFLLDKPEEEIYHSDVWNIQVLSLGPGKGTGSDLMQEVSSHESDPDSVSWSQEIRRSYEEGTRLPVVGNLTDLRHFDSLQSFHANFSSTGEGKASVDISGVEACKNLKYFSISSAAIENLSPLSEIIGLESLHLYRCGTVDLTPLVDLTSLTDVSVNLCDIVSLEPLTALPRLKRLSIALDSTFPSLEPLSRTNVEYLDMLLSYSGRKMYKGMDFTPLAKMPNLIYLDLSNHSNMDIELCRTILSGCPTLKYLRINDTPAAKALARGSAELDTENLLRLEASAMLN